MFLIAVLRCAIMLYPLPGNNERVHSPEDGLPDPYPKVRKRTKDNDDQKDDDDS